MILRRERPKSRYACWPLLLAALLAACGGGSAIIAVVSTVTPLGGSWAVAGTSSEGISFSTDPFQEEFFTSNLDVSAEVTTATGVCGGGTATGTFNVEGTIINGELLLRPVSPSNSPVCLQGSFIDLRTLEAGPPGQTPLVYQNDRVDVQMQLGLWVSDGGQVKLKFETPNSVDNGEIDADVAGCDVSSPSSIVRFEGEMDGFVTATGQKPFIEELRPVPAGAVLYTEVFFEDGGTLSLLNSSGQSVTLRRTRETTPTICPP